MPASRLVDGKAMRPFSSWRRSSARLEAREPASRFDATAAVLISHADQLAAMAPRFLRSLSSQFDVDGLAGRLAPVLLEDRTVALFALAEHVGGDQADELARRVVQQGYRLASPSRYVLAAPLLLAIARGQVTARSLSNAPDIRLGPSKIALADAFQDLLEWGVRHGASDIHLNVRLRETESEVKYTVLGRYLAPERFRRMPTSTLIDMLSVAWMDIRGGNGAVFDPSIEQQGGMTRQVDGKTVMLRWSSLAADAGPSVCLRMLLRDPASRPPTLDALGYLPDQIEQIDRAMLAESGAVVFAGAVGSGKSTSIAALMARLPPHRKVVTIEDPVEYVIPAAIQNTVVRNLDTAAHDNYSAKLRALKRSAMSDVLLGEIRDAETGRAFMDLAGSGVNVYTTVHAPSAALIPQRLASDFIGVSRDFLATPGMFKLLVFQVLLPCLCPQCALPVASLLDGPPCPEDGYRRNGNWERWLRSLEQLYPDGAGTWRVRNPQGCPTCRTTGLPELNGYAGRTVAAEIIEPGIDQEVIRSAQECAMHKAASGAIDPRDIEARFQAFETQRLRRRAQPGSDGRHPRLRVVP
ncbi:ATPase, T2SS/T4P/T4SS family [Pollutimonas sp. M17]|uniref:ATPase, T2SS/T4P/T4SS family n=1 Tax=Pollutimonas sp. M17 TaxID=2962065 RepID=UPI0021F491B6|nr:ATPase, T2SS/T4P/T4SS family [Pollutimonas sp. M17]UYO92372.1 ATPase, T2SS/T4P/T4SS family [Pollutimonas sp. M17]